MTTTRRAIIMAIVSIALLAGLGRPASAAEEPRDLYRVYCSQCHGMSGTGEGINVRDMSVQPRDHTDGKDMSSRSDQDIFKAIKEGGQGVNKSVLMPPWKDVLSDDEIRGLVAYLRTLCKCSEGVSAESK